VPSTTLKRTTATDMAGWAQVFPMWRLVSQYFTILFDGTKEERKNAGISDDLVKILKDSFVESPGFDTSYFQHRKMCEDAQTGKKIEVTVRIYL
jgi:hypothetical protein